MRRAKGDQIVLAGDVTVDPSPPEEMSPASLKEESLPGSWECPSSPGPKQWAPACTAWENPYLLRHACMPAASRQATQSRQKSKAGLHVPASHTAGCLSPQAGAGWPSATGPIRPRAVDLTGARRSFAPGEGRDRPLRQCPSPWGQKGVHQAPAASGEKVSPSSSPERCAQPGTIHIHFPFRLPAF